MTISQQYSKVDPLTLHFLSVPSAFSAIQLARCLSSLIAYRLYRLTLADHHATGNLNIKLIRIRRPMKYTDTYQEQRSHVLERERVTVSTHQT
jgi:hypothetical protein